MFITNLIVIISIVTFTLLLLEKINLRQHLQMTVTNEVLSKLLACDFCLCFWLGLIASLFVVCITGDSWLNVCIYPICSTPIARFLL